MPQSYIYLRKHRNDHRLKYKSLKQSIGENDCDFELGKDFSLNTLKKKWKIKLINGASSKKKKQNPLLLKRQH